MRGSVTYQVHQLFNESGINRIGFSKHTDKEAVREAFANKDTYANWHEIGQNIGIYSYATADAYRDVWSQVLTYAKEEYGVKDIEKLSGEIVQSYLESKVDQQVAYSTFGQYASACEKLSVALDLYASRQGRDATYDFHTSLQEVREAAREKLDRFDDSRAYARPQELVSAVRNSDHRLAAQLQAESGARVHEVSLIRESALLGVGIDRFTRQEMGFFAMSGKGGKDGVKGVSVETYRRLETRIKKNGRVFRINEKSYRESIKSAAERSGQEYQSTHGLRWNFAQERYTELQEHGLNEIQALFEVSQEMGHERGDITTHYLK